MREVSKAKLRKTLQRIARAQAEAGAAPEATPLSAWEDEYLSSLAQRLEAYGSAFRNPVLGKAGEPLSHRQRRKLGEIDAKLAGDDAKPAPRAKTTNKAGGKAAAKAPIKAKTGGGLTRRTPLRPRAKPRG
jgi:hypothetical protein